jgi:hypothetical protein
VGGFRPPAIIKLGEDAGAALTVLRDRPAEAAGMTAERENKWLTMTQNAKRHANMEEVM